MSTAVAPVDDATDDIDPRLAANTWLTRLFTHTTFMVFLVDVALVVLFTILSDNNVFWSTANFEALARNGTQILLLSAGLTLLLGSGVIDLSVGASLVLAATVAAKVMRSLTTDSSGTLEPGTHLGPILAGLLVAVAVGVACGVVNGLHHHKAGRQLADRHPRHSRDLPGNRVSAHRRRRHLRSAAVRCRPTSRCGRWVRFRFPRY